MKHFVFKNILFLTIIGSANILLQASEGPNIAELSEQELLKIIDAIGKETQSCVEKINRLSAKLTDDALLKLRVMLYQKINPNKALLHEIIEKRVNNIRFVDNPVLKIFSENVINQLNRVKTRIEGLCLQFTLQQ